MSYNKKIELISLIFNIIGTLFLAAATLVVILCIVNCKAALALTTDETTIANIKGYYGRIFLFAGMISFGVAIVLNLVGAMIYASNVGPSKKKNQFAFYKIIYVFVSMIVAVIMLALFYFMCLAV